MTAAPDFRAMLQRLTETVDDLEGIRSTPEFEQALADAKALLDPKPEHRPIDGPTHFQGWDAPFLARHLVDEHEHAEAFVKGRDLSHLVTMHQSAHDEEQTGYWLHCTFQASDDAEALQIAEGIVCAHADHLDANAWDISEGGDWSEIVERAQ